MDNRGFIKIHRKLLKWEWYQDINTKVLFLHLLLSANWEDRRWQGVELKRGQLVSGRKKLAEETGLSERQIRTSLDKLKLTDEVTIKTTNKYTLYTIVNYSSYQDQEIKSDQQNVQRMTGKRPAGNEVFDSIAEKPVQQMSSGLTSRNSIEHVENTDGYNQSDIGSDQQKAGVMPLQRPAIDQQATTKEEVKEVKNTPPIVPQRDTHTEFVGGVGEGDFLSASFSPAYSEVLECWKGEREKAGLSTGLIGKNSKTGAMKLAGAINRGEATLQDARKAIQNLLADPEKRETYSLAGLVNNFEIWVNRSPPESVKTAQLNQSKEVIYYSGICGECNYSVTGFEGGIATCPRCNGQIKLGKEV